MEKNKGKDTYPKLNESDSQWKNQDEFDDTTRKAAVNPELNDKDQSNSKTPVYKEGMTEEEAEGNRQS